MDTDKVWTLEEYSQGLCTWEQYQPTTSQQSDQELLDALPPATMKDLKQAALDVALGTKGFAAFFKTYPQFHQKFLLGMAKEMAPSAPVNITIDVPWLTRERLAYKDTIDLVQETPRALPDESRSWREGQEPDARKDYIDPSKP